MARKSNDELKAEALKLAEALGMDSNDLNLDQGNAELSALVKDLQAAADNLEEPKQAPAPAKKEQTEALSAGEKPRAPAPKPETEEAKKPPYSVAGGGSLTSKRGILDAGEEVKAEYLNGGKSTLDSLVERGLVVKG